MKNAQQSGTDVEETRRQLTFIENPIECLRLMIKNNMREDALEALNTLIDDGVYFQDASRAHGESIDGGQKRPSPKGGNRDGESVVCFLKTKNEEYLTLNGVIEFFGWKRQVATDFVVRLIQKAIEIHPWNMREEIASWAGSWETWALYRVYDKFVPAKHPIRPAVEKWLLEAWFQEAYFFSYLNDGWDKKWLGVKIEMPPGRCNSQRYEDDMINFWTARANALAKKFRDIGTTEDETREVFYRWLEKWGPGNLNPCFTLAVANMEIFSWGDKRRARLVQPRLEQMLKCAFEGSKVYSPFIIDGLIHVGVGKDQDVASLYRKYMAQALGQGKIALAHSVNATIGGSLLSKSIELKEVAGEAFDHAVLSGEFGIAAALVQQFGEEACFNGDILRSRAQKEAKWWKLVYMQLANERRAQIRESLGIAVAARKPIALDYSNSFLMK